MTIYYVDSNASGLNDGSSWTNAYADLVTSIAGSVSADDTVWLASDHYKDYAASTTYTFPGNLTLISVNSSNDTEEAGALEEAGGSSSDILLSFVDKRISLIGVWLKAGDDINITASGGRLLGNKALLGTIVATGSTISLSQFRGLFIDSYLYAPTAGNMLNCTAANFKFDNLQPATGHTKQTTLLNLNSGGAVLEIINTDLDALITTNLINEYTLSDDYCEVKLHRCKLPSGFSIFAGNNTGINLVLNFTSCDAGNGYDYFYSSTSEGVVEQDVAIFTTAFSALGSDYSAQINTNSNASVSNPLRYKLSSIPAQDIISATSVKVNTLTDGVTLTDNDFWIEAVYPSNTTQSLGIKESTQNSDILNDGSNLSTNTEAWTESLTTPIRQEVTVSIPASSNVDDGLIEIYINISIENTDIWVDPLVVIT